MIEFHDLTKRYGRNTALEGLTLTVPSGELFAFLGPNGAGKTTTIKLLTGLLRPTAGTVRVHGFDVQRQSLESRKLMGFVPDRPFLYPSLSGWEFLDFVGGMHGMRPPEVRHRAEPLMRRLLLLEHGDQLLGGYSHGMRQKISFIAALIHEPRVLVVDEPMVGLDPRSARVVKDLLRESADTGRTVFLSTHSLDVAEELADRVGILHHGLLVAVDTVDGLREHSGHRGGRLEQVFLQLTRESDDEPAPLLPAEAE